MTRSKDGCADLAASPRAAVWTDASPTSRHRRQCHRFTRMEGLRLPVIPAPRNRAAGCGCAQRWRVRTMPPHDLRRHASHTSPSVRAVAARWWGDGGLSNLGSWWKPPTAGRLQAPPSAMRSRQPPCRRRHRGRAPPVLPLVLMWLFTTTSAPGRWAPRECRAQVGVGTARDRVVLAWSGRAVAAWATKPDVPAGTRGEDVGYSLRGSNAAAQMTPRPRPS